MTALAAALQRTFGPRARQGVALAPLTTFKVGGPADWLVEVHRSGEIRELALLAREHGVRLTILGGGSNVLVADEGVRGIVARVHGGEVRRLDETTIRADAGVTINGLVRWTLSHGAAGLEAWAGTPGTVGGAVFGNAHFKGRLVSELIVRVTLLSRDGDVADVRHAEMEFAYDYSRLHRTGEVLLSADFRVSEGDAARLRATARESLAFRKRTQPLAQPSAGCIFRNPDPARDPIPAGLPPSAGALVDAAGLKGEQLGGAAVSAAHANFIVNNGEATARDIRALIARCKASVRRRFGVDLQEEIVYLGFEDENTMGERNVDAEN